MNDSLQYWHEKKIIKKQLHNKHVNEAITIPIYKLILENMYNIVTRIFVALLWTLCSLSRSLLYTGDWNWTQHSRCGMTSTKGIDETEHAVWAGTMVWEQFISDYFCFVFLLVGVCLFLTCLFFAFCKLFSSLICFGFNESMLNFLLFFSFFICLGN